MRRSQQFGQDSYSVTSVASVQSLGCASPPGSDPLPSDFHKLVFFLRAPPPPTPFLRDQKLFELLLLCATVSCLPFLLIVKLLATYINHVPLPSPQNAATVKKSLISFVQGS